jgi:RNA polymerase sigma-70 factor (ECF subfamily)
VEFTDSIAAQDTYSEPEQGVSGVAVEHELLRAAQRGNVEAYEQLQTRLAPMLRRFVRRLVGMVSDEDDILQDVFIALYYKMQKIDPVENLRPYVFRMVRNRCYDQLRSQGRFEPISLDDDAETLWLSFTGQEAQPEDLAHWLLLNLEVRAAIDRLPELQRQTLILYSEETLSYAEIAVVMDTNIGTVKSRLHHAKRTLAGLLKPETLKVLQSEFGGNDVV